MKPSPKRHILLPALVLILTVMLSQPTMSQPPPPPPGGHGLGGNQGGGSSSGAPIGSGMEIFLLLGGLYAGRKAYLVRSEE
jgi:hypothetical protein